MRQSHPVAHLFPVVADQQHMIISHFFLEFWAKLASLPPPLLPLSADKVVVVVAMDCSEIRATRLQWVRGTGGNLLGSLTRLLKDVATNLLASGCLSHFTASVEECEFQRTILRVTLENLRKHFV